VLGFGVLEDLGEGSVRGWHWCLLCRAARGVERLG